jgi:prevent-host-death family protein
LAKPPGAIGREYVETLLFLLAGNPMACDKGLTERSQDVSITTISSRQFNQDAGGAKKAADKGPVIITDRGRPAHVLLSFDDYRKLLGASPSLLDVLAQKEDDDFEFDPPRMGDDISRPVDLE